MMVSSFSGGISAKIDVINAILAEREAQDRKWGPQNHPDLSPRIPRPSEIQLAHPRGLEVWAKQVPRYYGVPHANQARDLCDFEHKRGQGSWFSIHIEELGEALEAAALGDTVALRKELVQLAATVTAHIEAIDRRKTSAATRSSSYGS